MVGSCSKIIATTLPNEMPKIIPTIPPITDIKTASIKNCRKISILLAPNALRIPISLTLI